MESMNGRMENIRDHLQASYFTPRAYVQTLSTLPNMKQTPQIVVHALQI